jgi:ankyrin repeat protein
MSDDDEEEMYDWAVPLFLAARGAQADVPEGNIGLPETGLSGVNLARRALNEGASLVAQDPATGLTALQLATECKVQEVIRYLQLRYVRALAAGLLADASDDDSERSEFSEAPLPDDIAHDPTAQLIEAVSTGDFALAQQARLTGAVLSTINVFERKQDVEAIEANEDDEAWEELHVTKNAVHQLEMLSNTSKRSQVFDYVKAEIQNAPQQLLDAARIGSLKMAKLARAAGAELDVFDSEYSYTPLLWAARVGSTDLIQYLLDEGAFIDARAATGAYRGSTPLLEAAAWNNVSAMKMLLSPSRDPPAAIDATRGDGATPLCIAAWVGHDAAVRLLLEHSASLEVKFDGNSPLHLAKKCGHTVVEQLLREETTRRRQSAGDASKAAKPKDNWLRRKKV